jgi:hypothetical protein
MRHFALALSVLATLTACGSSTGSSYDPAELERFKAALPAAAQLTATAPTATAAAARSVVPTVATFPVFALEASVAINGTVVSLLALLHALTDIPPTSYDATTHEFVWGPWDARPRFGKVAAYIKEQLPVAKSGDCASGYHVDPANAGQCLPDFHFVYVLARGLDADLSAFTAVIWGGANPDETNPTFGSGVTLWDFEADYAFAQASSCSAPLPPAICDPTVASTTFTRGRFVTLYGKGLTEDTTDPAGSSFAFDVAVFRDFVPADDPGKAPVDAEYFYGLYASTVSVGFMDLHTLGDIDQPPDGDLEDLEVRVAHLVGGDGRAEVTATCPVATSCSLGSGQATVVECWSPLLTRTYLDLTTPGGELVLPGGATEAACGSVFQNSLDALHIPTLDSIDPTLLSKLEDVAANGMP